MAVNFVVEDGTGLTNSTTYCTVNFLKQYWDDFGYDYSSYTDTQLEQTMNRSTRIIDSTYRGRFPGVRYTREQSLEWPRVGAAYVDGNYINYNEIPIELQRAICEMVYGILTGEADLQPVVKATTEVVSEEIKVDVIEEKKVYSKSAVDGMVRDNVVAVEDVLDRLIGYPGGLATGILRV
jgi:hypothetical protein